MSDQTAQPQPVTTAPPAGPRRIETLTQFAEVKVGETIVLTEGLIKAQRRQRWLDAAYGFATGLAVGAVGGFAGYHVGYKRGSDAVGTAEVTDIKAHTRTPVTAANR